MITAKELKTRFPTEQSCRDHLIKMKFGTSLACPKCKQAFQKFYEKDNILKCPHRCGYTDSITEETIFFRSRVPLKKWFYAIYLMIIMKNKVERRMLVKDLKVTFPTATNMRERIQSLANLNTFFN